MIDPYSNWQGPIWINTNYLYFLALKRYGFDDEAAQLAGILGRLVLADIHRWGSMHECYHAETGEGLAPTAEQLMSSPAKARIASSDSQNVIIRKCAVSPSMRRSA